MCGSSASAAHAKVIVVRLLGGLDWWKYGIERLSALARERGIALAVLPGEDRDDARLAAASTLPPRRARRAAALISAKAAATICARCCAGLARHAGRDLEAREPRAGAALGAAICRAKARSTLIGWPHRSTPRQPVVPIIFYRAMLLAADTAPIDALCAALAARGLAPAPLVVTSLKDTEAAAFLREAFARLDPARDRHHDGLRRRQQRR